MCPWSCQYSIDKDTVEVSQFSYDFKLCRYDSAVLSGVTLMLFASIVWLKLVSYAHTSYDMRALAKSIEKVQDIFLKSLYNYYSKKVSCINNILRKAKSLLMFMPTQSSVGSLVKVYFYVEAMLNIYLGVKVVIENNRAEAVQVSHSKPCFPY